MALRGHAGEDRDAAVAGVIRRAQSGAIFDDGTGLVGEVSVDGPGKRVISGRCVLTGGETAGNTIETLAQRGCSAYIFAWNRRVKKEILASRTTGRVVAIALGRETEISKV